MYDAVKAAWRAWNTPFEGVIYWLYLDTHVPPLVTTGLGNMVDPVDMALGLPWTVGTNGPLATQAQIRSEWQQVKSAVYLSRRGAGAAEELTTLRLSDASIDDLCAEKLDEFETILKRHAAFAAMDDWPADAQLGLMSMAWAMGPDFGAKWPHFSAAAAVADFEAMSIGCAMNGSPPPAPRNAATKLAFFYAARVVSTGADPSQLLSHTPG